MRLIDADALSKKIMEELHNRSMQGFGKGLIIANSCVINAPTIEPDTDTISRQKVISTINVLRPRCDTDDIDDYHDLLVEAMEVLPPSPSRQKDGKTMDKKTLIDNLIKILPENADITYATVSWWDEDDREHKNWDTEELCEGT